MDGLSGVDYLDSLQDKRRLTENGASVRFGGEVDRIYLATPSRLEVTDICRFMPLSDWPAQHSLTFQLYTLQGGALSCAQEVAQHLCAMLCPLLMRFFLAKVMGNIET